MTAPLVLEQRLAMADRARLLEWLCTALSRPGVHGVLGTADVALTGSPRSGQDQSGGISMGFPENI